MDGDAAFDAFIASCEKLQQLNELAAKEAEKPVADVIRASAAKATAPDGEPWEPKAEGGKALRGAAHAVASSVKGKTIEVKIGPPYVFHNYGSGGSVQTKSAERSRARAEKRREKTGIKSKFHAPRRKIVPASDDPVPEKIVEVLRAATKRVFERAMKGSK